MRVDAYRKLSRFRVRTGPLASEDSIGNNGAFLIPFCLGPHKDEMVISDEPKPTHVFVVIVSDMAGWDHLSVHVSIKLRQLATERCPSWAEMCFIKNLFFEAEEAAMQIHPPASKYVNHHDCTLHLWRPYNRSLPMPPLIMV